MSEHVRIGTGDDCDVKIRLPQSPNLPANGMAIEVERVNGTYRISSFDSALEVKLNNRPIKPNKTISDGDEIWIGPSGPSIHFFPIEATAALVNEKKIEGISEIRDESDRDGMRIVFELKRGEQAEVVLNNLYKQTQMQINFGVILLAIVNGQPRELGLLDAIKRFIEHRIDVIRRRTDYLLRKARDRDSGLRVGRAAHT